MARKRPADGQEVGKPGPAARTYRARTPAGSPIRSSSGHRIAASLAGLAVLAVGALVPGCSSGADRRTPGDVVSVTVGAPQTRRLGPARSIQVYSNVLVQERLTAYDERLRPGPRLVERWTTSPDRLTWRLQVRPNVKFQDGTPLTPAAVKEAIDRAVRDSSSAGSPSVCLGDVRSVDLDGDGDVVLRLSRPCYFLLDDLDVEVTRPGPGGIPFGTGPFAIQSRTEDQITLTANTHYYLGRPPIDRVVIRSYDTLRTAWAEMMRGNVDFLWEVGPDTTEFLSDQTGVELRSYPAFYCPSMLFNTRRAALKPPEVRRALNLATDRQELVRQAFKGQGVAASSPVWPNLWALTRGTPEVPFDRRRARAILAARPPITFTCLVVENFTLFERLALLVQRQLRDVGVDMRLESLPPSQFIERVGRGDFDAALINPLGGPYAVVHHRFWHSPDPSPRWNSWGYSNPAVDAALDAMRDAGSDELFGDALYRFIDAIQNDPPAIFLVWPSTAQAINRRFVLPDSAAGRDAIYVLSSWRPRDGGEQ